MLTSHLRVKYNENRGCCCLAALSEDVRTSYVSVSFRNALLLAAVHPCCVRVYLGDEDAVVLKQVMVVVATSQQLPDFSSEWLRNAAADQ